MPEARPLILVVEDDLGAATLQKRRLERAGFRASVAAGVDHALETLSAGDVSLVVMDYRLGTTTGFDLHRQMKAAGFDDVPVIMVTGATDDNVVVEAMRAGVRDFVVKTGDYLDYLPEAVRAVVKQAAETPETGRQAHRPFRVLVVEDDLATARLEEKQLERAGYQVAQAATAEEALAYLRRTPVDLALIDLRLHGHTTGLDLYEQMKAEGLHVPAILVTGFPDEAVAIRALRAGIRDFVPKSAEYLEYLPTAVDRVVAQIRLERRAVESELRLASIVGTTMDAIVMCDETTTIVLFNRSAEELFGRTAQAAIGQRLDACLPGLVLAGAEPAGTDEGVRQRLELDAVGRAGARVPVEVSVSEFLVHGSRLFTVIARDISERRRSEMELRERDRRKDEFLGMLAHELRNPLAAISNAGEVLDRTLRDPAALKLTGVVRRQTRALARMVDDLLEVSRVTLGKIRLSREPLLLSQAVTRAADAAREAAAAKGLHLDVHVASEPVWLDADATRLEQVLANLLSNAIKFTPEGGRIELTAAVEADEAVIRARDTGIGIHPDLLPHVFDMFVQADSSLDRSQSGLGIGLALVKQIVALHGGTVSVSSGGPGQGSEFVVRLPAVSREDRTPDDLPPEPRAAGRLRVLVVDDQPDMADCVAMLVETFGHQARAVYDGRTALAIAQSETPDVMFIDIGMPGMSGYEVARQMKALPGLSHVRLVALTGYGRDEDRSRALEAGFHLHLTKPVGDAELRSVLADLAPAGPSGSGAVS